MSEFSRETLLNIIETDHVQCGEASALARMALAAMDSEPVAIVEPSDYITAAQLVGEGPARKSVHELYEGALRIGDKLYRHAQPAPVVPEEATPDSIEILASGRCRDHVVYQWDEDQRNAAADSWNACRAAILAAAPHDTPALNSVQSVVTVPGKWIPVSERIPEDRKQVILWDAEIGEVTSGHYSHKTQTFYHCGDAIENEITHWMPPPCAPQEVK
ncbi:TPA: DUF551 domain-containing protein [Klebsiella variicola]|nr:DUF551 domain-containing protein [Klebsiella pneumoniae]HBT1810398.1 DUF551 domain-containing protein [Klebsiella pneumoniae]HDS7653113.1 DUF551 domain-containing protein [Klebsiella variicola]HDT2399962.1 DUF551 domain-containing protein [Klebsiella pneumoniae]HDU5590178.1 DUF551 domain-containing protein [Klebsiella variicola]